MQVQLLQMLSGPKPQMAGDIIDVDDETGQRMIDRQIAIAVAPPKPRRKPAKRKKASDETEE